MNSTNATEIEEKLPKKAENELNCNNRPDLTVCLTNGYTVPLTIGHPIESVTADKIMDNIYNKLHLSLEEIVSKKLMAFDSKYKKLFAIWITSPHLELQLQPTHKPYDLLFKWGALLKKHGPIELMESPELIDRDEPTLSLQRNVFCNPSLELGIDLNNEGVLSLLYIEAKLNVLEGRYPLEDFERLAAFQAAIDLGPYSKDVHTLEYFRQHLKQYIPYNYLKTKDNKINGLIRTLSRGSASSRCAQRIVEQYQRIGETTKYKLMKKYMEICYTIPCYGSAYFAAQIERPIKSSFASLMSHYDLKVWVAINRNGIHIISKERPELLLSIDYNDLCWASGYPDNSSDPNCIPCLFIQIPDQNDKINNILQIFSRQNRLIESLINSFIEDIKKVLDSTDSNTTSYDCTDGPQTGDSLTSTVTTNGFNFGNSHKCVTKKLSLAKFDTTGHCINKTGSWVRKINSQKI